MSQELDGGLMKIANDYKIVVSVGPNREILSITRKQAVFLRTFLQTLDINQGCLAAGVERSTATNWFRNNSKFKSYIKERLEYAADANGVNWQWYLASLLKIIRGKQEATPVQLEALKEIGKAVGYSKDRRVNEHVYSANLEISFTEKGSCPELETSQGPGGSGFLEGEVSVSPVRQAVGQDHIPALPASESVREAELNGVVCGPGAETGEGHSVEPASVSDTAGDVSEGGGGIKASVP